MGPPRYRQRVWPLLLACSDPPLVSAPPPIAPQPAVLTGRASSDGLDTPTLPGGAARLGTDCVEANRTLRGDGPPCFAEVWTAERPIAVLRAGRRLSFDGARGRTRWSQLEGVLSFCLGDPLAIPPAADPGGTRTLEGTTWGIHLSGANRCGLRGALQLDATRDHADWDDLRVADTPWRSGGRERAQETLRAAVREIVGQDWAQLDPATREDALRALAQDPHPDAKALLNVHR